MNSELAKRPQVLEGRRQRLERLAQASRGRLAGLIAQDRRCEEQVLLYKQRQIQLSAQLSQLEAAGHTQERSYFPLRARQLAADS